MKINLEELREHYRSHITDLTRMDRSQCPHPEDISDGLRGRISRKKKNEMVNHLSRCSFCLQEFQLILEVQREEEITIQGLGRLLDPDLKKRSLFPILQKVWKPARAVAAAVLVVVLIATLYFSLSDRKKFRGIKPDAIKLIQPINKKTPRTPVVFRWSAGKEVEYYVLELFDETLLPLWKSHRLHDNRIQLPPEVSQKLRPGQIYFWFVTGFISPERKIESPLGQFQIKR